MKRIYDRFSVSHNKESNSDKLLLFHHNRLIETLDLKASIDALLWLKGWIKE